MAGLCGFCWSCVFSLFGRDLSSHSRIFHSYGDDAIAVEGLQILTFDRHSWPLSSEGSLACRTNCDAGIHLYWSYPRTRDTHTFCRAFSSGAVTTCFYDLCLFRLGFEHPTFRLRGQHSNRWGSDIAISLDEEDIMKTKQDTLIFNFFTGLSQSIIIIR